MEDLGDVAFLPESYSSDSDSAPGNAMRSIDNKLTLLNRLAVIVGDEIAPDASGIENISTSTAVPKISKMLEGYAVPAEKVLKPSIE